jgi:O-antigen/teichoic acid export membrane protein
MQLNLLSLLSSRTAKDAGYMTLATGVSAVIAAVFFILVARLMGPEQLGVFSLATAASFMIADIFDVAINNTLIRFVARDLISDEKKANRFLKYSLKLKIYIGILIALLLTIFSKPISITIFHKAMPEVIFLVGIGTALQLIYTFTLAHLQARKRFLSASLGVIILPLLRAIGLGLLILLNSQSSFLILLAYFISLPFAFLFTFNLAPFSFFHESHEKQVANEFKSYCFPLSIGLAFSAISGRVDNFILASLAGTTAVGYYSAAFRLFTPVQYLAGAISTVFGPRFAELQDKEQAKIFFIKALGGIIGLTLLMLLFLPLSSQIVGIFYGEGYERSVPILKLLFLGFGLLLLQAPLTSIVLYHLSKPSLFAKISFVQVILIIVLNIYLIPMKGESGTALAFIISQLSTIILLSLVVIPYLTKHD